MADIQLNQILAIEKGVKTKTTVAVTQAYHTLQKAQPLSGIARSYRPKDDEGERLPAEGTKVQVKATQVLDSIEETLVRLFDVTLTKDTGNTVARADIVVDGAVLAENVPVTFLLFLEKQLVDLGTIIGKLPVLDPAETWHFDLATDVYATEPTETTRTKKLPRNHVLAPATDKHPAQVQMYTEDVVVGYWTTVKFSGAMPQADVDQLKERVSKLANAVKMAREKANSILISDQVIGESLFRYLFGFR